MKEEAEGDPRVLALCAGYGGLEMAVNTGTGSKTVAFAENDPYATAVFAAHHPGVPNLGDIKAVDWHQARDAYMPDIITAGFPCQNISNAGRREGITGAKSSVWKNVAEAVGVIRPRLVFLENVAAIRSRGLDTVAADLATLGYGARWTCLRAGDPEVGAPHQRDRWFAVAYPAAEDPDITAWGQRGAAAPGQAQSGRSRADAGGRSGLPAAPGGNASGGMSLFPTPTARSYGRNRSASPGASSRPSIEYLVRSLLPTPTAWDWKSGASNLMERNARPLNEVVVNRLQHQNEWVASNGTDYGPAIRRWEHVTGRHAPCPTEPGTRGNRRLSPAFAEWMMGLPAGWVTAVDGIPRKEQLRIIGNGVVPQQAAYAYDWLLNGSEWVISQSGPVSVKLNQTEEGRHTVSQNTETKPGRGRGRPRPPEVVDRDDMILALLREEPRTRNQLCGLTGLHTSIVYLSLSRLRRQGMAKLCQGETAADKLWSVDVDGPCP